MSNFTFLESQWSDLAKLGDLAEKYVYSDPNASMYKQGMLAEIMVRYMLAYGGLKEPEHDNTHAKRINVLKRNRIFPDEIGNILFILRKDRNRATHAAADEQETALNNLELLYTLCVWFVENYGDNKYSPVDYVKPDNYSGSMEELEKENKELEARNKFLEIEIQKIRKSAKSKNRKRPDSYKVNLTEAQTRELIDEQLRQVGWEADTKNLRYSKGTRPEKGKNIAIAEWPTDSKLGNRGYADYALFIGEIMVGIIEAKRMNIDVSTVLDYQCKDYAKYIKKEHEQYIIGNYNGLKVPFLFSTNGRGYLEKYKEKSGIWFLDTREPFNNSKPLRGWPKPTEMEEDLSRDIEEAEKKLLSTGYEILEDENGLNLRYYQIDAIKELEDALANRKNRGQYEDKYLIAMATGTGKTRTILGMIYRFLTARRFKRILYLVDRNALGEQTFDTFKDIKLESFKTLKDLYDIKGLTDKEFEKDTRVHIATVQGMVKRVIYRNLEQSFGVSDYDLIIVDDERVIIRTKLEKPSKIKGLALI